MINTQLLIYWKYATVSFVIESSSYFSFVNIFVAVNLNSVIVTKQSFDIYVGCNLL